MAVLEVSARQFRANQKSFFELADTGRQLVIKRGKQAYLLTPVKEDDVYFTPQMLERIDHSIQQVKEGKTVELTPELREELFGNL